MSGKPFRHASGLTHPHALHAPQSLGERVADRVTNRLGSWRFIIIQSGILMGWVTLNALAWINHWDPYPFILLNLGLSFQAAYSAPIIMMSQNRQSQKDRLMAMNDFAVNQRAEQDVAFVHHKLDEITENELKILITLQDEQMRILTAIQEMMRPST